METKSSAAEKIIASMLVWVGWYAQQIEALKRQLAWLKKQLFGRKSEATPANALAGSAEAASPSGASGAATEATAGAEPVAAGQRLPPHDAGGSDRAPPVPNGDGGGTCPKKRLITP